MTDNDRHHYATSGQRAPTPDEETFDVVEEVDMLRLDVDLGRVWSGIAGELWAPPVGRIERIAAGLLGSPALARALVATPSLVLSWVLASAVVFAVGAVFTRETGTPIVPLVAPVVAAAGVSFAYGAGADPAWELARTMPTSARMILLVRVVAVLATNLLLAAIASLVTPSLAGMMLWWLLPMLAIALLGLALATVFGSPAIGSAGALSAWGTIVIAAELRQSGNAAAAVAESTLLAAAPLYGLLAIASVFVIVWMSADVTTRKAGVRWS